VPLLDHDPGVGGRFSVLTNVGLLPAAIAGLNIEKIRAGAASALAPILESRPAQEAPPAVGAAIAVALAATKPLSVMMAYADRLERFTRWYVQLWAESLGKDGKGTTPLAALGPVDQHSQLQLFIGGPRDKFFTVVTVGAAGRGPRIDAALAKLAGEPEFAGKTIGDLVAAQGRATAETLAKNGCPVRTIHIEKLDEHALGELLMHFMLETIIAAHLLGVDPFDQPAVEEGKVLAKRYLTEA
jgi:glucose-6-phosphate isomerase